MTIFAYFPYGRIASFFDHIKKFTSCVDHNQGKSPLDMHKKIPTYQLLPPIPPIHTTQRSLPSATRRYPPTPLPPYLSAADIFLTQHCPQHKQSVVVLLNIGFDLYNCCTPSMPLAMSCTFLDLDEIARYMIASVSEEWLRPSRWPILCMATDSMSFTAHDMSRELTF